MKRTLLIITIALAAGCAGRPANITAVGQPDAGSQRDLAQSGSSCGLTAAACPAAPGYSQTLVDWVSQSQPFRGTVTQLDASTPDLPAGDQDPTKQIMVTIDQAWPAGSFLTGFTGLAGKVLMSMQSAPAFTTGYVGYFFGASWIDGQLVDLTEVGHADATPNLDASIADIQRLLADDKLFRRLAQATLVVHGQVTATRSLPQIGPISEHSPMWVEATVQVSCALEGSTTAATVPVRFNASDDISNVGGPKLAVGNDALYLLADDTITGETGAAYVVTDALDVQPAPAAQHLVDLAACPLPL